MVEFKNLPQIVLMLVLVGLIVGVGTLVLDSFSTATKTTSSYWENVTITANSGQLTKTSYITGVNFVRNATNTSTTYTYGTQVNVTSAGVVTTSNPPTAGSLEFNYTYLTTSKASTAIDSATSATGSIATNWLSLIVTVVVLAIILWFVVSAFANKSGRA
jgi:hypothetical protein